MSKTIVKGEFKYHLKTNYQPRELLGIAEMDDAVMASEFPYIATVDNDDYSPRFFKYRGSWYDSHEFQRTSETFMAEGFDGIMEESYFSAVLLRYFDNDGYEYDGAVVVGYVHW